jgi:hypothetical protein
LREQARPRWAIYNIGVAQVLQAGEMMYLTGNEVHAVRGLEDASLLVTILLRRPQAGERS